MTKLVQEKCTILLAILGLNHPADKTSLCSVLPQLGTTHLHKAKAYRIANNMQIGLWTGEEKVSLEGAFYNDWYFKKS